MEKKPECRNECLCTMYFKHFVPARTSQVYQRCSLENLHKFSLFTFFEEIDIFPPGTIDCEDSVTSNYSGNNYKTLIGLTHKKALHRKVVTINS